MATIYVSGDGSGDYNCSGVNDHIQINQALTYANSLSGHNTVYLRGPNTYNVDGQCIIKSDTTLTGDSTACIKLINNAGWLKNTPLIGNVNAKNINIHGFEIDGNHAKQGVAVGLSYYTMIRFDGVPYNINIYDMYLHDSSNDIIKIQGGYQNVASSIHDNIIKNPGHEAVYVIAAKNVTVYNNTMNTFCNAGIRTYNSDGFSFHDNYIYGSGGSWGIVIDEESGSSTGGEIYNNVIHGTPSPGIMACTNKAYAATSITDLHIHHNVVYNTGGAGIEILGWDNVLIENNVIDACRNGIQLYNGLPAYKKPIITGTCYITLRNNIITNASGYGIANYLAQHVYILEYNNVWNNSGGNYYGVTKGANDISVDPLYYDLSKHKYYLKSKGGTWNGTTWEIMTVTSPCIDTGKPTSSYSNEPAPNGGRINIGAYGNTQYASKSPSGTTPPPPPPLTSLKYIYFEAENAEEIDSPMTVVNDPNVSNGKYVDVPLNAVYCGSQHECPRALYNVVVAVPGIYKLMGLMFADSIGHNSMHINNSFTWHIPVSTGWQWANVTADIPNYDTPSQTGSPKLFNLSKGSTTFSIAIQEPGVKFDRFLLTNDLDFMPVGFGQPGVFTVNIISNPPRANITTIEENQNLNLISLILDKQMENEEDSSITNLYNKMKELIYSIRGYKK
uniref:Disaggregatase-related domain-containing protein n=1 Tax=viral metagenome TaxID=1070528 RepID=A0A6M3MDX3_9ZZZZ